MSYGLSVYVKTLDNQKFYIYPDAKNDAELQLHRRWGHPFYAPDGIVDYKEIPIEHQTAVLQARMAGVKGKMLDVALTALRRTHCRAEDLRVEVFTATPNGDDKNKRRRTFSFLKKEFESVIQDAKFIYKNCGGKE